MNKYRLKESDKYKNIKSNEAKNGKPLVERFIENYFAEKEKKQPRKFILREKNKEDYKRTRPLREYRYNAVQPMPPYCIGDEVVFTAAGEQRQGKITDLYHYGNERYIFTVENAVSVETGDFRTFTNVTEGSITQDVIS
jgi:hypothetical protein